MSCDPSGGCSPLPAAPSGACELSSLSFCVQPANFVGCLYFGGTRFEPRGSCQVDGTVLTQGRPVFVTHAGHLANFGGLAGADSICTTAANGSGLVGTYKAWLSSSTTSAASRLSHGVLPYVRLDGAIVANDWADLIDGSLASPIAISELGTNVGPADVWTATAADGSIRLNGIAAPCADWTSTLPPASPRTGATTVTDARWTDNVFTLPCSSAQRLFCLRNDDP